MDTQWEELFDTLYTQDQAAELIREINTVITSLYNRTQSVDQLLHENVSLERKGILSKALLKTPDDSQRQKLMSELKTAVEKLPVIDLELSFYPTEKTIRTFYVWVRQNIGKKVLIHVRFNPTLIAGVIIRYNGKYKDYSLQKFVEAELQKIPKKSEEKHQEHVEPYLLLNATPLSTYIKNIKNNKTQAVLEKLRKY